MEMRRRSGIDSALQGRLHDRVTEAEGAIARASAPLPPIQPEPVHPKEPEPDAEAKPKGPKPKGK